MSDSGTSTPRFTAQSATAEDLLKTQTVGLVHLDEFRKRRRDVEELRLRDTPENSDGTVTPRSDEGSTDTGFKKKKKRKIGLARGLLSFGEDEESFTIERSRAITPSNRSVMENHTAMEPSSVEEPVRRKLTPNPNAKVPAPKVVTKASVAAETAERERLRMEFIELQEQVRGSEVAIPFVFYDGSNLPGGTVKIKKGDQIWLFLEKCRKVGAEMGVGGDRGDGAGIKAKVDGRKSWARIGVDDLMCVRGEIIIPHHYELYYFIANRIADPLHPGKLLFDYTGTTEQKLNVNKVEEASLLRRPKDEKVEGQEDEPAYTKVVDRRWYEKNKHIYPASMWKDYKSGKDFEEVAKSRKDAQGNSFFFA